MEKVKETKDYFWFEIDGGDLKDKKAMQKHTKNLLRLPIRMTKSNGVKSWI